VTNSVGAAGDRKRGTAKLTKKALARVGEQAQEKRCPSEERKKPKKKGAIKERGGDKGPGGVARDPALMTLRHFNWSQEKKIGATKPKQALK